MLLLLTMLLLRERCKGSEFPCFEIALGRPTCPGTQEAPRGVGSRCWASLTAAAVAPCAPQLVLMPAFPRVLPPYALPAGSRGARGHRGKDVNKVRDKAHKEKEKAREREGKL